MHSEDPLNFVYCEQLPSVIQRQSVSQRRFLHSELQFFGKDPFLGPKSQGFPQGGPGGTAGPPGGKMKK